MEDYNNSLLSYKWKRQHQRTFRTTENKMEDYSYLIKIIVYYHIFRRSEDIKWKIILEDNLEQ